MSALFVVVALGIAGAPEGIERSGKDVTLRWTVTVETQAARVVERLIARPAAAVSGAKSVKARGPRDLRIERKTPFFLPKVWFEVEVHVARQGEVTVVEWRRKKGTAKRYLRQWTVRPKGGGSEVEHRFELEMPFDLPDVFARGQLKKQRREDRERLIALVRAER